VADDIDRSTVLGGECLGNRGDVLELALDRVAVTGAGAVARGPSTPPIDREPPPPAEDRPNHAERQVVGGRAMDEEEGPRPGLGDP
jgi:hypothetical protein